MRSPPISPAKRWCCGGDCSTRNSTSSMATDARVPSPRSVGRSRYTSIGSSRNPRRTKRRSGGGPRRPNWPAQGGARRRRAPSAPSVPDAKRRRHRSGSVSDAGLPRNIAVKLAVADEIGMALAKVTPEDRAFIDALLRETLAKDIVFARMRAHFRNRATGGRAMLTEVREHFNLARDSDHGRLLRNRPSSELGKESRRHPRRPSGGGRRRHGQ